MNIKKILRLALPFILLVVGAVLYYTAPYAPGFIDRIFSDGFYKLFSQALSLLTGLLPFSLAEFGFIALVLFIIAYPIYIIVKIIVKRQQRKSIFVKFAKRLAAALCLIYFAYVVLWGLNYSRLPFATLADMEIKPASVDELTEVCQSLIVQTNTLRNYVTENRDGVMFIPGGYKDIFSRASYGFDNAAKSFPFFKGNYGSPKAIFFSEAMTYSGIVGVYCPFTAEANVDVVIPDFMIPNTTCHEMAHQRGFAREDEANYIAYLTCSLHPDNDFKYSGSLLAMINSMNALYSHDRDRYSRLSKEYSPGVLRDLKYNRAFWKKYSGPVEKITDTVNDAYLKANMQKDGVHSYGRMVDLLIAEYRKNNK